MRVKLDKKIIIGRLLPLSRIRCAPVYEYIENAAAAAKVGEPTTAVALASVRREPPLRERRGKRKYINK